ncbi:MAG: ABC transporter substrate-binding protein, partial [Limnothrix sp.]|nr:ABC transporter substrate-binding protein [Limnothrix sp.]
MSSFSRRKFLFTAATAAGATVVIHGCAAGGGNQAASSPAGGDSAGGSPSPAASIAPPEVTKAKLGFIALTDAAPLIIAKEKGLFAKYGMPDV